MPDIDPFSSPMAFFASELFRMRTAASLSVPALAKKINGYGADQIYKVENCERFASPELAKELDRVFKTGEHFYRHQQLVANTSMLPWFRDLYMVESKADKILIYEPYMIPGILQTEAYAHAAIAATRPILSDDEIRKAVALQMTRQEILKRKNPPRIWAIIDQPALLRIAGSPELMREQYGHLLDLSRQPNIVIQVIPNSQGFGCAAGHAFKLLSFQHQNDMVYLEEVGDARYLRKPDEVSRYETTFDHLRALALSDDQSRDFISRIESENSGQ
jgi:hypothetical protein